MTSSKKKAKELVLLNVYTMPRRWKVLTTLLIALPWAILLTIWHQHLATHYLTFLKKETDENATNKSVILSITQTKEESLPCISLQANPAVQQYKEKYVYTRPPPWSETLPTIFVITPTYTRSVQKAELTRLANTFLHIQNLHWIIVEDSPRKTNLVAKLLDSSGLSFTHLNIQSPKTIRQGSKAPRGTLQRNQGLQWLRQQYNSNSVEGVVYFADDDNTYSLEVFDELRYTKKVSVWPVAFVGGLRYEAPKLSTTGRVVGWKTVFDPKRPFAVDMAGFAVNIQLILQKPNAIFRLEGVKGGYQETSLLKDLVIMEELEPKAANCTKKSPNTSFLKYVIL
ncbi:galactosylgalactosylxylosylprotein 3-beta-glucuronosyltransferase 1-like isoform X2 [Protopterus annectens]|uniref:galactosylgalactosylxylosylprotein 3-beta-glucuronosyltransferase 1-like isoform X2 n=1 Tax=Protopterus annectens TaxID=7888 RepID=UPI001CF9E6AB|nr:galactosylgalactosylxylosylprotein 3-beta-glucuronosyltransferase 1-like isoform X2 [Protopterus annectens]